MPFDPAVLATRFGYGLPLPADTPSTPRAMLAALAAPDAMQIAYPLPTRAESQPLMRKMVAVNRQHRNDPKNAAIKAVYDQLTQLVQLALRTSVARALDTPDTFRERLVAFWTNHFCTRAKSRPATYLPALFVEEAIRPHLAGNFADLLIASTTHPAMVLYLDQNTNVGPELPEGAKTHMGLNENLGREVMELHSLGVGAPYTQTDVRQMSKLLTGLTFDVKNGHTFDALRVEPGTETVLGKTYGGKKMQPILAVLHDLAARPETARHISTQLATYFVADTPPEGLVAAMTKAYLDLGGQLMAVYEALLTSPEAAAPPGAKVRWPNDYIPTSLRALGLNGASIMALNNRSFNHAVPRGLRTMGMPWLEPAGPNGFPDAAAAWINPPYLAARIAWAMNLANHVLNEIPEPVALAKTALGDHATPDFLTAVSRAETKVEGVGLVLASTALNRR